MKRRVLCLLLTLCLTVATVAQTAFGWSDEQASLYTQFGKDNDLTTQQLSNMEEIYVYLTEELNLNTAVACGLLANMHQESRIDPKNDNTEITFGICQWAQEGRDWIINWCTENGYDPESLNAQLAFLKHEFLEVDYNDGYDGTYYNKIYQYLLGIENSAEGAYEAAYYFCYYFERPSNKETRAKTRGDLAQNNFYPFFCQIEATGGAEPYDPDSVLPFRDVRTSDWFYDHVVYAYQNKMVAGVSSNRFAPSTSMTRAMAVQILYNLSGAPDVGEESGFSDVSSSAWYASAVTWAKNNGVTAGTTATTFSPNSPLTRESMVQFLYNYYTNYLGELPGSFGELSGYSDYTDVTYGTVAMEWAVGNGIVTGVSSDGSVTLQPAAKCSRAQGCTMLSNFAQKMT